MTYSLLAYFTDPLLYASTWGCLLLGLGCGLVGTILFLQKASLMGETLSHASYPGLMASVLFLSLFPTSTSWITPKTIDFFALLGAWISSLLGLGFYNYQVRSNVSPDAALCWTLSSFLGVGVLIASKLQFSSPRLYHRAQIFLYGQAATLSDSHLWLLATLVALILFLLFFLFRPLLVHSFDKEYAFCLGLNPPFLKIALHFMVTALLVSGLRAGGVLLMAALLVAPAVAARGWSHSFQQMLLLAACVGALSAVLGNILSLEIESLARTFFSLEHLLPTGPAIVLVGSFIALLSLLLAPQKGLFSRWNHTRLLKKSWLRELKK